MVIFTGGRVHSKPMGGFPWHCDGNLTADDWMREREKKRAL